MRTFGWSGRAFQPCSCSAGLAATAARWLLPATRLTVTVCAGRLQLTLGPAGVKPCSLFYAGSILYHLYHSRRRDLRSAALEADAGRRGMPTCGCCFVGFYVRVLILYQGHQNTTQNGGWGMKAGFKALDRH